MYYTFRGSFFVLLEMDGTGVTDVTHEIDLPIAHIYPLGLSSSILLLFKARLPCHVLFWISLYHWFLHVHPNRSYRIPFGVLLYYYSSPEITSTSASTSSTASHHTIIEGLFKMQRRRRCKVRWDPYRAEKFSVMESNLGDATCIRCAWLTHIIVWLGREMHFPGLHVMQDTEDNTKKKE